MNIKEVTKHFSQQHPGAKINQHCNDKAGSQSLLFLSNPKPHLLEDCGLWTAKMVFQTGAWDQPIFCLCATFLQNLVTRPEQEIYGFVLETAYLHTASITLTMSNNRAYWRKNLLCTLLLTYNIFKYQMKILKIQNSSSQYCRRVCNTPLWIRRRCHNWLAPLPSSTDRSLPLSPPLACST